jgi:hypothetical protein
LRPHDSTPVTEILSPNDKGRSNECEIQHPQPANLWMRNPHHVDVAIRPVANLVEGAHDTKVLKHDENIP